MDRRHLLKYTAGGLAAGSAALPIRAQRAARPFVLVAGAFSGGWLWARTADLLRAAGHRVFTCSLTGMGDRAHLLSKDISMDTFVDDVVATLLTEELSDVVLVGSSFGGIPVSGAVDRVPERVAQVVFLDAVLVEPGRSAFDALPAEVVAARRRLAQESSGGLSLPPPPVSAYAALGISEAADVAWCQRRFTPHPIRTYESPLNVKRSIGGGRPCTYVACLRPNFTAIEPSRKWAREQAGWRWIDMSTGHLPMVTAPAELCRVLIETAAR
jgi:pimeloyl-ACP methyl ester carboxylesterase